MLSWGYLYCQLLPDNMCSIVYFSPECSLFYMIMSRYHIYALQKEQVKIFIPCVVFNDPQFIKVGLCCNLNIVRRDLDQPTNDPELDIHNLLELEFQF